MFAMDVCNAGVLRCRGAKVLYAVGDMLNDLEKGFTFAQGALSVFVVGQVPID